ncbi:hypothetical protein MASR1M6_00780 [Rubrivivax sp.]
MNFAAARACSRWRPIAALKLASSTDDAALAADVGGEVQREAEGVVQLERGLAVDLLRALGERRFEDLHAVGDGLEEALLLDLQHFGHAHRLAAQLGVGLAHLGGQRQHEFMEEGLARAQLVAVADGAAGDAAQHVAAALVAGDDAVGDGEGAGADVVGDDLEARRLQVLDPVGVTRPAGIQHRVARGREQGREEVDLVVAVHMLQHRGQALEAHAGVDTGLGQAVHRAVFGAVELHEDVVPDLDVAVAILLRAARRAARDLGAVVVEDLAARAAGAGVAHHPEVVGLVAPALVVADAHDALGRQADHLVPDVVGLVVLLVDGGPQALGRQLEVDGQQLPGVLQRVVLEVVAEAEVAEHLEEGVVPRRVAHVLEVVVLAAGADALLRRRRALVGPLVEAEEHVLELVHARVGEEQRRVVARNDRAGSDDLVPLGGEVVQEGGADLGGFHVGTRVEGSG